MAGRVDVDRMLSEMTSRQFEEWRLYDRLHPIGDLRAEIESARLLSYLAQMMGNEDATVEKLLWSYAPPEPSESSVEIRNLEREVLSAFGIK